MFVLKCLNNRMTIFGVIITIFDIRSFYRFRDVVKKKYQRLGINSGFFLPNIV